MYPARPLPGGSRIPDYQTGHGTLLPDNKAVAGRQFSPEVLRVLGGWSVGPWVVSVSLVCVCLLAGSACSFALPVLLACLLACLLDWFLATWFCWCVKAVVGLLTNPLPKVCACPGSPLPAASTSVTNDRKFAASASCLGGLPSLSLVSSSSLMLSLLLPCWLL